MQRLTIQRVMEMSAMAGACSDLELLEQLITRRSESAFTQLMHRHGAMVLGVCRRILRHTQDAEDACQATFLVLSQRAAAIEKRTSLASWLYGVAARVSLRLKKIRHTRATGGNGVPLPPATSTKNSAMAETLQVLDQEMARLPEQYRAPLVLCFLEGRTQDEAAKQLGWPLTTLRGRLERGRQTLRKRLQSRGFDLSVLLLGIGVTSSASAHLSQAFIHATTQAMQWGSVRVATRQGVLAASVSLSAEQVMKSMSIYQWTKGALALLAMLSLVGIGAWAMTNPAPSPKLIFDDKPATVQPIAKEGRVEGRVLDEDGKPVAGATVQVMLPGLPNHLSLMTAVSGSDGKYGIDVPFGHAMIWGIYSPAGYYCKHMESHRNLLTNKEDPVSQQDCKLLRGMPWRIQVDNLSLMEGEKLLFTAIDDPNNQGMRMGGDDLSAQGNSENIGTVSIPWSGGEYRFAAMPNKSWGQWELPAIDLTVDADFQPTKVAQVKNEPQGYKLLIDQAGKTAKVRHAEVDLKNGLVTLSMKARKVSKDKLLTMQGRIVNEEKPVAGAKVTAIFTSKSGGASSPFHSLSANDGSFAIQDIYREANTIQDDSEISVSIVAPKYQVTRSKKLSLKDVHAKSTGDVGTIKLEAGKTLRGKVVDENGKPLQGATITDETNYLLYQSQCRTDANGEFVIEGIRYGKLSIGVQYGERSHYERITVDEKNNSFTFVPKLRAKPGYREASSGEVKKKQVIKVDEWKLQPPVKEPAYQHTPLYALVAFGLNREQAVWMVLDGRTLYIDRNGNGDLTEADEKLSMMSPDQATARVGNPGFYSHFDVTRTSLQLKGHEQETLELLQWMRDDKFVPKTESERQQKAEFEQRGNERFLFTRKKNDIESSYGLVFVRDKNDVQVLYLDGPLTFALKMREQTLLQRGPAGSDLAFHIGTPGRSPSWSSHPTFSPLMVKEVPEPVHLLVEVEFPGMTTVAEPIVKQFTLKSRCCGDTFHGTVFVPADAGPGQAKVTVRAQGWDEMFVQPKTFLVAIE